MLAQQKSPMRYIEIITHQIRVALRQDMQRFFLGIAWWFIEPVLYILVFYLLFKAGLRFGSGIDRMIHIIVAISTFRLFTAGFPQASKSLISGRGLMNQVALPKWIFPVQVLALNFIKFLILLLVLFIYLWLSGVTFTVHSTAFIFILLIYLLLTLGVSLIAASLVPFLPDLQMLIANLVTALFFLSGVFYDIRDFSVEVQQIFYLNPLAVIIQSVRDVLLLNSWPMWNRLFVIGFYSVVFIFIGSKLLAKFSHTYPKMTRG